MYIANLLLQPTPSNQLLVAKKKTMQLGQRWGNNPDLSEACSLQPQGLPTRCLGKISPAVKENQKKKVGDPVTPLAL